MTEVFNRRSIGSRVVASCSNHVLTTTPAPEHRGTQTVEIVLSAEPKTGGRPALDIAEVLRLAVAALDSGAPQISLVARFQSGAPNQFVVKVPR